MNEFNIMVLNVAVIVFIIALIVVGYILYFSVKNSAFPPYDTQCPTYYKVDPTGENCIFDYDTYPTGSTSYPALAKPGNNNNSSSTGANSCETVPISQFNVKGFSSDEVLCAKNRWAQDCGVFWDGVTNNKNACFREHSTLFS
tara:strand:+ start:99 stop:527 length:429 start_codon:yes stop_codon:yes gene_type:complete